MCGIAGIISLDSVLGEKDLAQARAMTDILRHRGPNSKGFFSDSRCALGNTRLSIIDLSSSADLPAASEDRRFILAYNGEITNYRELASYFRLGDKYGLRNSSDTEVLLRLCQDMGLECLRHLSGMFAFCLYDSARKKAWLVRDFYGTRPLFYMQKGGRLYFSSEIKSFMGLDCFSADRLDSTAIFDYFALAYVPGAATPFQDVRELEGGCLLEIDLGSGKVEHRQYYSIDYTQDLSLDPASAAGLLRARLEDAVSRNLISDAPLGMMLSGGVDTSSLLVLARHVGAKDLHTFSVRMLEPSYDEYRYQKIMTDFVKPAHHQVDIGPREIEKYLYEHLAYMDEPSGDGACIPFYALAAEAKKHVSVLMSGEGGDEVFNAYETYRAYKARKLYRRFAPGFARAAVRSAAASLPSSYSKLSFDFVAKRFTEGAEMDVPRSHLYWRHVLRDHEQRELMPDQRLERSTDDLFAEMFYGLDCDDDLNRVSQLDFRYYLIGDLLLKNDRMIMAHSIEARYPYLDRRLVEFSCRLPVKWKLKGFSGRYIQKLAVQDLLPPGIFRRKNMGLELPHSIWFLNELKPLAESFFSKQRVERTGLLDHSFVQRLWRDHLYGRRDYGRALWCILVFIAWHEMFVEKKSYASYLHS
ncbi:MAG: asparagine synthase (glutamine-hydrolyzing) [Elusimicrobia bacterium]|nr:asparagine synthase (glutamine-hydrolyzing) [Elusimicrobiota bacterium]